MRSQTLFINPSNSKCGNCNKGATWREATHDTVLGYFPKGYDPGPGCGVRWVYVSTEYTGYAAVEAAKDCRPDLEWIDLI